MIKKNYFYFLLILLLILLSFIVGFFIGYKKIFPFYEIRSIYYYLSKQIIYLNLKKEARIGDFDNCKIPKLRKIPKNSTIIIGHAYGSYKNSKSEDFYAPEINNLIEKNHAKIDRIIFNGDVFAKPNKSKWNKLKSQAKDRFILNIAPGNHDFINSSFNEVFRRGKNNYSFPYKIINQNIKILIDNSIETRWNVSDKTFLKINKKNNFDQLIVIRHNTPINELLPFVNSQDLISPNLLNYYDLNKKIEIEQRITWIIGDGGAVSSLRCFEKDNNRFIINGIGQVFGDQVIVINKNKVYSFIL